MKKRLIKSTDKKLFGVAGGVADYFEIDPTLVRVGFIASAAGTILRFPNLGSTGLFGGLSVRNLRVSGGSPPLQVSWGRLDLEDVIVEQYGTIAIEVSSYGTVTGRAVGVLARVNRRPALRAGARCVAGEVVAAGDANRDAFFRELSA